MALISTKNLVTPLTNMVNIITVLLLAVCFAVLRLSGASIAVQASNSTPSVSPIGQGIRPIELPAGRATPDDELFKPAPRVIGNGSTVNSAPEKSFDADSSSRKRLDDIEKSLGIR